MTRDDLAADTVVVVADPTTPPSAAAVSSPDEARVSPLDRGFLYGDAAFETVRCYDGAPAFLSAHVDRLRATLSELRVPYEPTVDGVRAWVDRLLAGLPDGPGDAYVRLSVTRGPREGLLAPTETDPTLVGVATSLSTRRYEPATVETVDVRRHDATLYRRKTHNYLPSVLARGAAPDADETLMRDDDGRVASGAVSNVFVVRESDGKRVLRTPDHAVRPGVTREVVRSLAADLGLAVRAGPVEPVVEADAAFLTNSTWGVRPVGRVDGESLPVTDTVETLAERYLERALVDARDADD